MNNILWVLILLLSFTELAAQVPKQQIRGRVYDEINRQPLPGAQVFLKDTEPLIGTVTDEQGYFTIENVPVGRYVFVVSFVGYSPYTEDLLVKAGNDPIRKIALVQSLEKLEEVIVTELPYTIIPGTAVRKITAEQSIRFAANYLDPARVMTSFPGVMVQNDQNNNLVINGKSPNGLLWRVEGFDVVNPNHLSNAGTLNDKPTLNGGGVNILSAQMLGQTNFVTLPFSAEYGNAYSGIMDMRFRDGNKYDNEYTAQASLIGIDLSAEGPLKKGNSSFLANYRYSTVGLLTSMGVDFGGEEIGFQDFSFKLAFDHETGGTLSIFGFAGKSENHYYGKEDPAEWEYDKDSTRIFYASKRAALGFKDTRSLHRDISLSYGSTVSYGEDDHLINNILRQGGGEFYERTDAGQMIISTVFEVKGRLTKSMSFTTGLMNSFYQNRFKFEEDVYIGDGIYPVLEGFLWQPYFQAYGMISPKVSLTSGVRYMRYSLNNTDVILPNARLDVSNGSATSFFLNYGRQGKLPEPRLDLMGSSDLEFSTVHHLGLGMNKNFSNSIFTTEVFYEKFGDLPVSISQPFYSAFNDINENIEENLVSEGRAKIYGINASLERPFLNGIYYIISGAWYNSTYKGYDNIERDSRFNGNYQLSFTGGKEIFKNKTEGVLKTTTLDLRGFYAGGMRTTPINEDASRDLLRTVYNNDEIFSQKLGNYKRLDFRISWRKERANYTRVIAIDIQNVFSLKNDGWQYFDLRQDKVVTKSQLGIIPILIYRVEF